MAQTINGQAVPAGGTAAPATPVATPDSLSASGSNMLEAVKAIGAHFGQMAAYQRLANWDKEAEGRISGGFSPEVVPPSAPLPSDAGPGGIPDTHSQYTNPSQSKAAALTDMVNTIGAAAKTYVEKKHQADVIKSTREFTTLMTAIQANKNLNPNDPEQAKMIDYNNNVINDFFADKGKSQRLTKILGFDAFDAKAQAKKEADPHYQAYQAALKNVGPAPQTGVGGVPAPADANMMAASMQKPPDSTDVMPWTKGLNPQAQQFMSKMPIGFTPPTYVMGPRELAEQARVAAKIIPDGNERAHLMGALATVQGSELGHVMQGITDVDVQNMKNDAEKYKTDLGETTAWNVAVLSNATERMKVSLESSRVDLEKLKVGLEKGRLDNEHIGQIYKASQDQVTNASKLIDGLNHKKEYLEGVLKNTKNSDQTNALTKQLNGINADINDAYGKYSQAQKDQELVRTKYYGSSSGAASNTAGAASVESAGSPSAPAQSQSTSGTSAPVSNPGGPNSSSPQPASVHGSQHVRSRANFDNLIPLIGGWQSTNGDPRFNK